MRNESGLPNRRCGRAPTRLLQENDCLCVDPVLYDASLGKRCAGGGACQPPRVPGDDLRRGAGASFAGV
eukprot:8614263-Lingulodinium_polyedra.AAC.1